MCAYMCVCVFVCLRACERERERERESAWVSEHAIDLQRQKWRGGEEVRQRVQSII